ncbi:MAG: heme exporter protein CcmB [Shewanella sp.]|uniref:heme exporter protein CcmB n=1 Tax=Shewanella sp. TaxID=50422 RepID=UPI003569E6B5
MRSGSRKRGISFTQAFFTLLQRDLKIAIRHRGDIFNPLLFFIMVVTLFPLGIGPEPQMLARVAPGIIWVAALLASMLSLERLFKADFSDGSLEQMLLSPQPLAILVLAKVLAHWILTGVPLIIIAPLLAVLLNLDGNSYGALISTLALGTPVLSLLGAIGVALTVGLRKGGVLLSLLILPLYIPVLIFATSAIDAAGMNLPYDGQLAIIGAMLVGSLTLAPFAIGASLRVSTN